MSSFQTSLVYIITDLSFVWRNRNLNLGISVCCVPLLCYRTVRRRRRKAAFAFTMCVSEFENYVLFVLQRIAGLMPKNALFFSMNSALLYALPDTGITYASAVEGLQNHFVPKVQVYLNNIICYGTTQQDHDANLQKVLHALNEAVLKLNMSKFKFDQASLPFLGHIISKGGLHLDKDQSVQWLGHLPHMTHAP